MSKLFKISGLLIIFSLFLLISPARADDSYYFICTNKGWFTSDINLCKDISADQYNNMTVSDLLEYYGKSGGFDCETGSKGVGTCNQIIGLVSTTKDRVALSNPLESSSIPDLVGVIIKNLLSILGGLALIMFIVGAFKWISSAGNPEKVKSGMNTMVYAALGILVVFSSYMLVNTVIRALKGGM